MTTRDDRRYLVLSPDFRPADSSLEEATLSPVARFVWRRKESADAIETDLWRNAHAVLLWHEMILDSAAIRNMGCCRIIVRVGVGTDNVDVDEAQLRGIRVSNIPDYGVHDVADFSIALAVYHLRNIAGMIDEVRHKTWSWSAAQAGRRLQSCRYGVLGLGRIGMAVALRAKAMGACVAFYDPYLVPGVEKVHGFVRCSSVDELVEDADVLSLHVPLTEETRGLIGENEFARMRRAPVVVNTARGEVMSLNALEKGLREGRVHAAAIDVHEGEPNWDHTLIAAWLRGDDWIQHRLSLTPHCAFLNDQSLSELRKKACLEVVRYLSQGEQKYEVTRNS